MGNPYKLDRNGAVAPFALSDRERTAFLRLCLQPGEVNDACAAFGLPVVKRLPQDIHDPEPTEFLRRTDYYQRLADACRICRMVRVWVPNYALLSLLERHERNTPANKPASGLVHLAGALAAVGFDEDVLDGMSATQVLDEVLCRHRTAASEHVKFLGRTRSRLPADLHPNINLFSLTWKGLEVIAEGTYEQHAGWVSRLGSMYDVQVSLHHAYHATKHNFFLFNEFGEVNYTHVPLEAGEVVDHADMPLAVSTRYRREKLRLLTDTSA